MRKRPCSSPIGLTKPREVGRLRKSSTSSPVSIASVVGDVPDVPDKLSQGDVLLGTTFENVVCCEREHQNAQIGISWVSFDADRLHATLNYTISGES